MNKIPILIISILLLRCGSPTVKIASADKPIEINLNIKIDHNIKVKVDKEVNDLVSKNEDGIF